MGRVALIVPVCLQVATLLDRFRENLKTFRHDAIDHIVVLCNRLTIMNASTLETILQQVSIAPVQVVHDVERSVAGAWNRGIEIASEAGCRQFLITAVDVAFTSNTVDDLIRFGTRNPDTEIWSSNDKPGSDGCCPESLIACDFACFMLRTSTVLKYGWFDREFKPAYFEDVDYVTRVVLGGGQPRQVLRARHFHDRSLTLRLDPDAARSVYGRFALNEARFVAKWRQMVDDCARIHDLCYRTPFDSGRPLSWWPEQEQPAYSPTGGMDE